MNPSAQSGIEIGVGVMAICVALVGSQVLLALKPARRRLLHWIVWTSGVVVAVLPLIAFHVLPLAGGLVAALFLSSTLWSLIELRWRWTDWIYVERAARMAEEEKLRAYHPKSFGSE
jgi:uncharacterized membrane protein